MDREAQPKTTQVVDEAPTETARAATTLGDGARDAVTRRPAAASAIDARRSFERRDARGRYRLVG
jgi:hypothetical protein